MAASLKRTPIYPLYAEHNAKTIDFGGWEMPVQFESILKEHSAVRERAGLFDVSHMGEFLVSGADATNFLQRITTNDVSKLEAGAAQYSFMCYPDGGTVDDLIVYKLEENKYMTVVNASNRDKDWEWMQKHAEGEVEMKDISEQTALLAVQGPTAVDVLAAAADGDVSGWIGLPPFRFVNGVEIAGVSMLISRTGYTGEDGFELYMPSSKAEHVWRSLLAAGKPFGLVPVGLGARDTLRFEAKLPLYGQELSADISPMEAGLGMFVKLDKGFFLGWDALAAQKTEGVKRKLVGIEMMDRGIPRSLYSVFGKDGEPIGRVTTGTQSPTLKRNLGLAIVNTEYAAPGTELYVDIRGKRMKAVVVKTPFYKREKTTNA